MYDKDLIVHMFTLLSFLKIDNKAVSIHSIGNHNTILMNEAIIWDYVEHIGQYKRIYYDRS